MDSGVPLQGYQRSELVHEAALADDEEHIAQAAFALEQVGDSDGVGDPVSRPHGLEVLPLAASVESGGVGLFELDSGGGRRSPTSGRSAAR